MTRKSVLATVGVRGPVDYTVVNGKITVREGRLACIDEEKLARDAQAKMHGVSGKIEAEVSQVYPPCLV